MKIIPFFRLSAILFLCFICLSQMHGQVKKTVSNRPIANRHIAKRSVATPQKQVSVPKNELKKESDGFRWVETHKLVGGKVYVGAKSEQGKMLVPSKYTFISCYSWCNYFLCYDNEKYALYDLEGNEIFSLEEGYTKISKESEYYFVRKENENGMTMLDKNKNVVIPLIAGAYSCEFPYENKNVIIVKTEENFKYVIDLKGNIIISPVFKFEDIDAKKGNFFECKKDGKVAIMTADMKELIPLSHGATKIEKKSEYIDNYSSKEIFYYVVYRKDEVALYDTKGRNITMFYPIPKGYDDVKVCLGKGNTIFFEVSKDDKTGIILADGKLLIPLNYTMIAYDYAHDYFRAYRGNDVEEINKSAKGNISMRLTRASDGFEYSEYYQNGKYGIKNKYDKVVLSPIYSYIMYLPEEHVFEVEQGENRGIISQDGKEIIPISKGFTMIYTTHDGNSWCYNVVRNKKYGIYNRYGKELIPCTYDIVYYDKDSHLFYINGEAKYIDPSDSELPVKKTTSTTTQNKPTSTTTQNKPNVLLSILGAIANMQSYSSVDHQTSSGTTSQPMKMVEVLIVNFYPNINTYKCQTASLYVGLYGGKYALFRNNILSNPVAVGASTNPDTYIGGFKVGMYSHKIISKSQLNSIQYYYFNLY